MPDILLDVREIEPRERHPRIFTTFDGLAVGDALVLANDHDPRPLFYQFKSERQGAFDWTYLEQGPLWRVRITKTAQFARDQGACCGTCGG
ncbi:MAG: DUF2249 domain-containing protein [Magnetospirillum sp.]|nr:DUF2249 domain-containing protein [Magnetospirillum sp.]